MRSSHGLEPQVSTREEAKALFPLDTLKQLDISSALRCQSILGHGTTYGCWQTHDNLIEHMNEARRHIDLRRRLISFLPKVLQGSPSLDELLDEGVLYLTRLGLLMRMGPAGVGLTAKGKPLDATTIAGTLYEYVVPIVARGIERRLMAGVESSAGFAYSLTPEDLKEFCGRKKQNAELLRLTVLCERGLWSDLPPQATFKGKTTSVRGVASPRVADKASIPYSNFPDDYMAQMGPRVLWLILDMGPNLIHLLHALSGMLGGRKFATTEPINRRVTQYFEKNVWKDRFGEVITAPPFVLKHDVRGGKFENKDAAQRELCDWPPRHWNSVKQLAATLQRAHLWLALLVMSSRHGEVLTLKRDCVEEASDGKLYVNGKSYKSSRRLAGKQKKSPPPDVLVRALAQQVQLVAICEHLANLLDDTQELVNLQASGTFLWASLGPGAKADPTKRLKAASDGLLAFAETLGMDPRPGGSNVHPHRFRKTIARLAGVAIDGSQKVLMLLLGHDDVTTTLLYMQADPAFAKEVDEVTRELRILRAQGLIEDMHAALHAQGSLAFAGHGGAGARTLSETVNSYEKQLHQLGKEWGVETARELAVLLTNNGESARLINAHVVCTKTAGEWGLCSQKKGAIAPGNCQIECTNHIELATGRRDTLRLIPILVRHAEENLNEGNWLAVENDKRQLDRELRRYDDINETFRVKPEVQKILGEGE